MASILLRPKCVKSCVCWPRIFSEIVLFAQKIYQQLCTLALDMITSEGSTPVRGISEMASISLRPKCVKSCVCWPRIFSEIVLFAQKIYQQLCTLALDMITSEGSTPVRGISYRSQPPTSSHRKPLGPHSHYLQKQEIIM